MNVVTLDFETTNKDKGDVLNKDNHIVLACWHRSWDGELKHVFGTEYDMAELVSDLRKADLLVAHNVKFELQWISRITNEDFGFEVWDTMLAEYVLAGNRRWDLSLDSMAEKYGLGKKQKLVSSFIQGGVCPSEIPNGILLEYCKKDVILCLRLYERLSKELEKLQLKHIHRTRCRTAQALAQIELEGVTLDTRRTLQERDSAIQQSTKLQAELDALSGGLNWNSPKQVAAYLYGDLGFREVTRPNGEVDRTDAGQPRTDESTILKLRPTRSDQKKFLSIYSQFIPLKKRVQTLKKLGLACEENGGKLHFSLNQTNTQTHRLSSTGKKYKVQGQNIDRGMKRLVVSPDPDYYVCEIDYAQLEFRGAAQLGRCAQAIRDILDEKDIHKFSGSVIFKIPEEEVKGEVRTAAKAYTFKPLYGGNSGTKDEKAYYNAFRRRYKGIYDTQVGWTYQVLGSGQLVTEYGMRFYWPGTRISQQGYIDNTPSIFNYPVQSFSTAEIVPMGLVNLWRNTKGWRTRIINTVHDSVLALVHKDEVVNFVNTAKYSMTTEVAQWLESEYGMKLIVPLGIEIKIGTYWGDNSLIEEKYNMEIKQNDR
jgi:DNA polymerase-1